MEDYQSSHSGQEIDTAVTNVLNGTCGIQGVKLNGVDITPDSSNKINISTASFFTTGSFTPKLSCWLASNPTDPEYTGTTTGSYYLIDKLCYINFYMNITVNTKGVGYYRISQLPFTSTSSAECAISVNAFNFSDGTLCKPTITMHTIPGTSVLVLEQLNGIQEASADASQNVPFNMEIGGTGFYIIA